MSSVSKFEGKMKNHNETRIALLEQNLSAIADTLIRMEKRFDKIDDRFTKSETKLEDSIHKLEDKLDKKLEEIRSEYRSINNRLWSNFLWMLGTMFTLAGLCGGIMAKGFGWFN